MLEYIELSRDYGITEFEIPGSWEGKSLMQLNVRAKCGVNILAVRRGGEIQVSPNADYVFEKSDVVVALGNYKALSAVQKK